jgi:hypothetical protein
MRWAAMAALAVLQRNAAQGDDHQVPIRRGALLAMLDQRPTHASWHALDDAMDGRRILIQCTAPHIPPPRLLSTVQPSNKRSMIRPI